MDEISAMKELQSSAVPLAVGRKRSIAVETRFGDLPIEIVERIICFLDSEDPAVRKMRQEPSWRSSYPGDCPLKNLSLTCWSLRKMLMKRLFRSMIIECIVFDDVSHIAIGRISVEEFKDFLVKHNLTNNVSSLSLRLGLGQPLNRSHSPGFFHIRDVCLRIIHCLDLRTLTILAPPSILPYLICGSDWGPVRGDEWAFDAPLHAINYSQVSTKKSKMVPLNTPEDWDYLYSHVTLNEGSSIRAYSSYEYFNLATPSIFAYDCFQRHICNFWSVNLRSLTYIAIFPISPHVQNFYCQLRHLENLETFSVQFAPSEDSDMLSNPERIGKCQISDLWMEFRLCLLATLSFARNFDLQFKHKIRKLTLLDWFKYDTAAMLAPDCEDQLRDWVFDNGSWKRLEE